MNKLYNYDAPGAKLNKKQFEEMVAKMGIENDTDLSYKYRLSAQRIGEIRKKLRIESFGRGRPIEHKPIDCLPLKRHPWSNGRRKKKGWIQIH